MDYGLLLKDAWRTVWSHKFLLLLGFLAALGSGGSAGGNNFSYTFNAEDIPPGFERNLDIFLGQFAAFLLGFFCLIIVLMVVFWLIRLAAQAGLISAVARLAAGEKVSLGQALGAGIGKLGRMIGIYVVLYGPFILLVVVTTGLALLLAGAAIGYEFSNAAEALEPILASLGIILACAVLLLCVLVPLWLFVSIILPFAQRAAVLEDQGVLASVGRGWRVITGNLGEAAILVLLILAISIGYGFLVAMIMIPLAFVAFVPMFIDLVIDGTFNAGNFLALLCGAVAVGVLAAVLNALWTTYRSAIMTLAYQQLAEKTPMTKVAQ